MNEQKKQVRDMAEQKTQPLNVAGASSASDFLTYVKTYRLELLDVALAAGVRYLTVWNLTRGRPVTVAHAALVRAGLFKLTGVAYTAPISLVSEPAGSAEHHAEEQEMHQRRGYGQWQK